MKCISELFNDISTIRDAVTALNEKQGKIMGSNQKLIETLDKIEKKDSYEIKLDIKDMLIFYLYRWQMEIDRIKVYMYLSFYASIFFALIGVICYVKILFVDAFLCIFAGFILNISFVINLCSFVKSEFDFARIERKFTSEKHQYIRDVNLIKKFSKMFYPRSGIQILTNRKWYIVIAFVSSILYCLYLAIVAYKSWGNSICIECAIYIIAAIIVLVIIYKLIISWRKIK